MADLLYRSYVMIPGYACALVTLAHPFHSAIASD